jgi:predicted nuclease of predicted toxin-antitoxin system
MKIIIDMNLSLLWVEVLQNEGWETLHWSTVGDIKAPDSEIMEWAKRHGYCIFTHDLDFSAILASTKASSPSVFQIRMQDIFPKSAAPLVTKAFRQFQRELESGAIVTVNEAKGKVRILPI